MKKLFLVGIVALCLCGILTGCSSPVSKKSETTFRSGKKIVTTVREEDGYKVTTKDYYDENGEMVDNTISKEEIK